MPGFAPQRSLEHRHFQDVIRAHDMPPGKQQFRLGSKRVDQAYPAWGLLVELDGQSFHREANLWRDFDRDNHHLLAGWRTLRFGWRQVTEDPCRVAQVVGTALSDVGWPGTISSCPHCLLDRRG